MAVLEHLEPIKVFQYFEEICGIPHGSGNIRAISDYLAEFARKRNLEYYQDKLGNVIIIKEASKGYENADPVMLQGHMDMVAVSDKDADIDLVNEGLYLAIDGDEVYAEGTTLGGDDGIALAYILAILDSKDAEHPRLEAVFTVDEEVGMDGAKEIDLSVCRAGRMINIDSEEEGYLLAGCAGGATFQAAFPLHYTSCTAVGSETCHLTVTGLQGGHSGTEIHREPGNANLILARVIYRLMKRDGIHLVWLDGGKKDNAIPHMAEAELLIEKDVYDIIYEEYLTVYEEIKNELKLRDPGVCIRLESTDSMDIQSLNVNLPEAQSLEVQSVELPLQKAQSGKIIEDNCAKELLSLIQVMPQGVCGMSPAVQGLVETSLNLGVLTMEEDKVFLGYSVRSSVASRKEELLERMKILCEHYGASWNLHGVYPGWEYRMESPLRDTMCGIFKDMYGKDMVLQAIHAGLECGFFAEKIPGLDCVSFGPDIKDIHTTRERLSISSAKRMYEYLLEVLKAL